jgi:hypothetical protein
MRSLVAFSGVFALAWGGLASPLAAQTGAGTARQAAAAAAAEAALPPATKLEGFKPAAGSVLVVGYDELGAVQGVSVDVREMRDAKGAGVRGLVVEVYESQYRKERSFVDADEVAELLKGFDALLDVKANPTPFKSFEVRYTTHGELQLTAFNDNKDRVLFAVQAGRGLKAQQVGISMADMQALRAKFEAALQKLNSLNGPK